MANLPKPKILPKVTYNPPSGGPGPEDIGHGIRQGTQGAWDAMQGLWQYGSNLGQDLGQGLFNDPKVARPDYGQPKVAYPDVPLGPPTPTAPWDTGAGRTGAGVDSPYGGSEVMGPPSPTKDQWDMANKGGAGAPGTGNVAGPPSPSGVPQSALDNNRRNMAQAQAAGDTANMARLDAEWKRIAPLAQQYGISANRLVNSYMQPSNPAAKSDFNSALAAAISDDVWAKEATNAFGRPPNQLEWDEHWKAMNVGGRDPLEGHPQSVQNIQAAMNNIGQANQQAGYDEYSKWLAGQ